MGFTGVDEEIKALLVEETVENEVELDRVRLEECGGVEGFTGSELREEAVCFVVVDVERDFLVSTEEVTDDDDDDNDRIILEVEVLACVVVEDALEDTLERYEAGVQP